MFSGALHLNCDLPSVHRQLAEPEFLYSSLDKGTVVVLDEIHRLEDPSRVLQGLRISFCGLDGLAKLFEKTD